MFDLPPPPTVPADTPIEIRQQFEEKTPLTRACLELVSSRYKVHPLVISLVAQVEGGWSGARIKNTNGTFDLGKMQINTIHIPELSKYGITEKMLQNNDCISVGVAAWYIRKVTVDQTATGSEDYFRAIARYHSKNEPHLTRYANKLMDTYRGMIDQYNRQTSTPNGTTVATNN